MTIPILSPEHGKCLACGGPLTEKHSHSYQDDALMAFFDALTAQMVHNGCILVGQDGALYHGHPPLKNGYMWMPIKITNIGPHEECEIAIPHHHCE